MKKLILFLFIALIICIHGCKKSGCPEYVYYSENQVIKQYHQVYFPNQAVKSKSVKLGIYIDFSDGMQTAFLNNNCKEFYNLFVNSLNKDQVDFYELANSQMNKIENLEKSELYDRIKNRKKFVGNFAPIDEAIEKVVNENIEAILITDGELFTKNLGERDDPWARPAFSKWLRNGNTIEFYLTEFVEKTSNKHLFFMFFIPKDQLTDENNSAAQFKFYLKKSIEAKGLSYDYFSFSNSNYKIEQDYKKAQSGGVDENATLDESTYMNEGISLGFEYQEYSLDWKKMMKYIYEAMDDYGNPIKGGLPVVSKLFIETSEFQFYNIDEIGIKVTSFGKDLNKYKLMREAVQNPPVFEKDESGNILKDGNGNLLVKCDGAPDAYDANGKLVLDTIFKPNLNLPSIQETFIIDNEYFIKGLQDKKRGEIAIKIHPNYNGSQIDGKDDNFFRVDIYFKKVSENTVNKKLDKFVWKGIQLEANQSMYNSILGALKEANPQDKVVYTYYIKTPSNNYYK